MNIDQIRENMRVLQDDILHLERSLLGMDPDSPEAESKDRILNVKWRLFSEQKGLLDRAECNAAREAAEARWHHHEAADTLDLY